jgi:hypothetical protein
LHIITRLKHQTQLPDFVTLAAAIFRQGRKPFNKQMSLQKSRPAMLERSRPALPPWIRDFSWKRVESKPDVSEVEIRGQDIGDPKFRHDRHSRKIGKRYSWFVRELFPQFNGSGESGLGDLLDVNEWRLHDIRREMPGILKGPALE